MVKSEIAIILGYLLNILNVHGHKAGTLLEFNEYLGCNPTLLGDRQAEIEQLVEEENLSGRGSDPSRAGLKKLRKLMQELMQARLAELKNDEPSTLEQNLRMLSAHLELDAPDRAFLGLVVRHRNYPVFNSFLNEVTRNHLNTMDACAVCIGLSLDVLVESLGPHGRLMSSGALQRPGRTGSDLDDHYQLPDQLFNAISRNNGNLTDLLSSVLGEPTSPALDWDDFCHLGTVRERLATFMQRANKDRAPGVNILLWGEPGTGKTEFCKTLAAHLGYRLYPIGEADDEGGAPSRQERVNYYRLSQNLLRYRQDTLLLFDEMDDLFEGNSLARMLGAKGNPLSKVFMNRLLENNPVPALWLINNPAILDDAFVRRMSLAIEVKVPPPSQRERVWQRLLTKNRIELPPDDVKELAALNLSPALIDSAARYTHQVDGSAEDFRFAAQGILHLVRGRRPVTKPSVDRFQPELTHADIDLNRLTERLRSSGNRAFSLCLYGPPGTGKSAYLRFLAERMEMPVLIKRTSDLLDKYVGGSEKQIAEAFQEAIDQEALLIFDEADSLLGDRRQAVRSWEISQVNEMLTWMECHPLPFACTTNMKERLDQASLRRFTFKCYFDYLSPEQVAMAFHYFFQQEMPSLGGTRLFNLTPGDFAVVRRKAEVLGELDNPSGLVHLLGEEIEKKSDAPASRIGFAYGH